MFCKCVKLSRVNNPAGDLQLDALCLQALQPGQQSPALRETHRIKQHQQQLNFLV